MEHITISIDALQILVSQAVKKAVSEVLEERDRLHEKQKLLNINEAANYLNKTKYTIYKYCNDGLIHEKVKGVLYFKVSDLDDFMQTKRHQSANSVEVSE